jgi:probable HAF family extracellular repeat protein
MNLTGKWSIDPAMPVLRISRKAMKAAKCLDLQMGYIMLNRRREIVQGTTLFLTFAMIVSSGAGLTNLDVPGASVTAPRGINSQGNVVGLWYNNSNGQSAIIQGFLWKDGTYTTIDVPGGFGGTFASGINDQGEIVGGYYDGKEHGFLYRDGVFTAIDFPGAVQTDAYGINQQGDIVGLYLTGKDAITTHGFLLRKGIFTSIDFPGSLFTRVFDINNRGDIVGGYFDPVNGNHGFVFEDGTYTTVDVPGVNLTQEADAINDQREIVGTYFVQNSAIFFLRHGSYTHVAIPGGQIASVGGINDKGDISGSYTDSNSINSIHGFVLQGEVKPN